MTRREKRALAKDDIDLISTSDVENFELDNTTYEDFFIRHRINLSKAILDKDGGYSLRELKKIYKAEMEFR